MAYFSCFEKDDDEPLTPGARVMSRPEHYQIMNCAVTTAGPIDVKALKTQLADSAFTSIPRFNSLLLRNPTTGHEYWHKTSIVLDDHVKVIDEEMCDNVNDYLAELADVSSPLQTDKPLWEVHILTSLNTAVFRVHHALADGISFMSVLQSFFTESTIHAAADHRPAKHENKPILISKKKYSIWELIQTAWYTVIFALEIMLRCTSFLKDKKTIISGGDGVQLWPRKLATALFTLEDINIVKKSVLPNATLNDVMLGVLASGLSEYINLHSSSNDTTEDQMITAMIPVNIRPFRGIPDLSDLLANPKYGLGNKTLFVFHPMRLHKPRESEDLLQQLKEAKTNMDKKKLSKIAQNSHLFGQLFVKFFTLKITEWMLSRIYLSTTFIFSNIVGPSQEVTMAGKQVTSMKFSISSLPHAMTLHMLSYADKAELQILVAKDIIHDPDVLAKCFEDALQRMKKAAITASEVKEKLL